jgi:hypothetical protein
VQWLLLGCPLSSPQNSAAMLLHRSCLAAASMWGMQIPLKKLEPNGQDKTMFL